MSEIFGDDEEAANAKQITPKYIPRPLQWRLHKELRRFNVVVCHRRFGKSVFAINHMISQAIGCKKPLPRYAYIAPTFGQAKRVMWTYLKEYTSEFPGVEANEADLRVDFIANNARIMLLSAENPNSLRGIYLDGVILDEYADMNPAVWSEVVRPTLVDRHGWALFIGTLKGMNHLYELGETAQKLMSEGDKAWFHADMKASETGIIPESELAELRKHMSEEEYLQEFENDPRAGLVGAYFAKDIAKAEKEGRIRDIPYDPMIPVDTYWDLGMNDQTSVWFIQSTRFEHRLIDYFEVSGSSIPETIAEIAKKKYNIDEFVLPHDAAVRDLSTGKSRQQMFYLNGARRTRIVPRVGSKADSINAARVIFGKCYFDKTRCAVGLKHLSNYQKKWDGKNNTFQNSPLHNSASNCFTGDTKVVTRTGTCRIDELSVFGEVLTICGWKPYKNLGVTRRNAQVVEVVFESGYTVRCTPEHLFLTENGWKSAKNLVPHSRIQSILTPFFRYSMEKDLGDQLCQGAISREALDYYIDMFGLSHLVRFLRIAIFTTKTEIKQITNYLISNVFQLQSIYPTLGTKESQGLLNILLHTLETEPRLGINQRKADFGIRDTCEGLRFGSIGREKKRSVDIVQSHLWPLSEKTGISKNGAPLTVEYTTISGVRNLQKTENVWDLSVPAAKMFVLENGAVAHNCADAFQCFALGVRDKHEGVFGVNSSRFLDDKEDLRAEMDYDYYSA